MTLRWFARDHDADLDGIGCWLYALLGGTVALALVVALAVLLVLVR